MARKTALTILKKLISPNNVYMGLWSFFWLWQNFMFWEFISNNMMKQNWKDLTRLGLGIHPASLACPSVQTFPLTFSMLRIDSSSIGLTQSITQSTAALTEIFPKVGNIIKCFISTGFPCWDPGFLENQSNMQLRWQWKREYRQYLESRKDRA